MISISRSILVLHAFVALQPASASAAPEAASVTIYAAGDIADCRTVPAAAGGAAKTAALLAPLLRRDATARLLTLGDSTYPDGALSEFKDCYDATWGQFKA